MTRLLIAVVVLLGFSVTMTSSTDADQSFSVPDKLRPRVNFWKAIFTQYGERQFVIHHRMYPQVVFRVVDLEKEGTLLSDGEFARYRQEQEEFHVESVRDSLLRLADGEAPRSALERHIVQAMRFLNPTTDDYRALCEGDLIRTQTGIKERFAQAVVRAQRLLPSMERIFSDFGLPVELTRIPFIESSFDSDATSSVGAAGIWQFMRNTARGFGLAVTPRYDQRRDPLASSRAAARYLKEAYRRLKSWPLAVTSYNHGVGGINQRLARFESWDIAHIVEHPTDRPLGFASTNFYPEFLAAVEVYREREKYFSQVTEKTNPVAQRRPISPGEFKKGEANSKKRPRVVSVTKFGSHKVKKGETLSTVSSRYGVSLYSLKSVNALRSTTLRGGQMLKIPLPSVSGMKRMPIRSPSKDTSLGKTHGIAKRKKYFSPSKKNPPSKNTVRAVKGKGKSARE
jgi:membrane-bound lytic murein transglycosylase D